MKISAVCCSSSQQVKSVREQRKNRLKRAARASRASGKVEDQGSPYASAHTAAEGGKESMPRPLSAHPLGETLNESIAHFSGGFGGHVAWCESGATCRDH